MAMWSSSSFTKRINIITHEMLMIPKKCDWLRYAFFVSFLGNSYFLLGWRIIVKFYTGYEVPCENFQENLNTEINFLGGRDVPRLKLKWVSDGYTHCNRSHIILRNQQVQYIDAWYQNWKPSEMCFWLMTSVYMPLWPCHTLKSAYLS